MRIASWNVNSLRVRLEQVIAWLEANPVDVLALQETKVPDEEFPTQAFQTAGYHALANGQRAYNGVALISRSPAAEALRELPGRGDPQRRVLFATYGELRVANLYVPNGKTVDSDSYAYKLRWLADLRACLAEELASRKHLVVLGDFNIAPDDRDVYDPQRWAGHVHVSAPERDALAGLSAIGLRDTFRLFEQPPAEFSWWDYRAGAWRRNNGLRIDLILASAALAGRCTVSRIDRGPRGAARPSDHAPVLAEFDI